jgi:uncharacterized protein (DUF2267 family)
MHPGDGTMDESELIGLVKERAGLRTAREAKKAVVAALGALRSALEDSDAQAVAAELPRQMARHLERTVVTPALGVKAFYVESERRERVGLGFAMEHAQVTLQVLAELLQPELVARLRRRLPADIAALLKHHHPPAEPPPHVHMHPAHRDTPIQTLARSRPGASETIAEARGELAHHASVARTGAPRAERMIASAASTRPGREDETLATSHGDERRR